MVPSLAPRPLLPLLLLAHLVAPAPAPVRYDQRQTGNLNVQVDLKDVEIFAILDGSLLDSLGVGGDYDYDYSQLTEKPPAKPGNSSTTSTAAASSTSTTRKPSLRISDPSNGQESQIGNHVPTDTSMMRSANQNSVEARNPAAVVPPAPSAAPTAAPTATPTAAPTAAPTAPIKISVAHRRCGAGFHRDNSGRCRRNRRPLRKYTLKQGRRPVSRSAVPGSQPAPPSAPLFLVLRESVDVTSPPAAPAASSPAPDPSPSTPETSLPTAPSPAPSLQPALPPAASPHTSTATVASPSVTSPLATSPPATSPLATSPPATSPPLTSPTATSPPAASTPAQSSPSALPPALQKDAVALPPAASPSVAVAELQSDKAQAPMTPGLATAQPSNPIGH